MENLRKTLQGLPKIAKILLAIFFDGIYGGIYRITGANIVSKIVGVVMILCSLVGLAIPFVGIVTFIIWVADIYTIATKGEITFLAD